MTEKLLIGVTTDTGPVSQRVTAFAWLAIMVSLLGTLGSLLLSLGLGLKACPLCFYQRTFMISAFLVGSFGLWTERRRPGLICLLVVPLAWAGFGVAAFHEYLVVTEVLECPTALFGIGTAPVQSLILFGVLVTFATWGAWVGKSESTSSSGLKLLTAIVVGGITAWASVASSPPLPPIPKQPYDPIKQPLDMCRPPYREV
jgi:disulfide bond formation protein DsbB